MAKKLSKLCVCYRCRAFLRQIAGIGFSDHDVRRLIQWAVAKIIFRNTEGKVNERRVSRSISQLAGFRHWWKPDPTDIWFTNKYNYQITHTTFIQKPPAFKGLKIVHISDIHSGVLIIKAWKKAWEVLDLKPDLIFSGDLSMTVQRKCMVMKKCSAG
jgi:hypothetical protein